jgi:hypothetical protein
MNSFTAPPISTAPLQRVRKAELVFSGVDMAGDSFEGRVFLNNAMATEHTARTAESGYAGSFHVYGYGDPPPPEIAAARNRHVPGSGPIAPIETRVRIGEELLQAAVRSSNELLVTVVPVSAGGVLPERPFETVTVVVDD